MAVVATGRRAGGSKYERSKQIAIVHQVVERRARVDAWGRKHLEEGGVPASRRRAGRVVAAALRKPHSQPWLEGKGGLHAPLDGEGVGQMGLRSPVSVLQCTPEEQVDFRA